MSERLEQRFPALAARLSVLAPAARRQFVVGAIREAYAACGIVDQRVHEVMSLTATEEFPTPAAREAAMGIAAAADEEYLDASDAGLEDHQIQERFTVARLLAALSELGERGREGDALYEALHAYGDPDAAAANLVPTES